VQAKKVRVAEIERIRGTMKNAPEHPVEEVTTAEAVRTLSPETHAMQAKGYGLPAIAAHLSDNGLTMTTKTLKTYLTEARATVGRRKRRAPKRVGPATGAGSTAFGDGVEARWSGPGRIGGRTACSTSHPEGDSSGDDAGDGSGDAGGRQGVTGTARPGDDAGARRAAFVPKEDTRDI